MEDHANFCDGKKEIVTERKDKQENKRLHSQLDTHMHTLQILPEGQR